MSSQVVLECRQSQNENHAKDHHNSEYPKKTAACACDEMDNWTCSSSSVAATESHREGFGFWQEPIVVGYAFGPKKMSTMGTVLAEASKTEVLWELEHEDSDEDDDDNDNNDDHHQDQVDHEDHRQVDQHSAPLHGSHRLSDDEAFFDGVICADDSHAVPDKCENYTSKPLTAEALHLMEPPTQKVIFSIGKYNPEDGTTSAGTGFMATNLKHIVRYFQSSCSSAGGSVVAEDELSSTPTVTSATTGTSWTSTLNRRSSDSTTTASLCGRRRPLAPIRLNFIPLDPDLPLHEQGKFDLVLHKLTEDILSCSLQQQRENDVDQTKSIPTESVRESFERVGRLLQYKQSNPQCCLLDDPICVQTLMSRSDIARVLQSCLDGVKSTSGRSVSTPRYIVLQDYPHEAQTANGTDQQQSQEPSVQQRLDEADMSYPLIAKPLIAAGTKHSHYMTVLLGSPALAQLCGSKKSQKQQTTKQGSNSTATPKRRSYLLQEYVNHNAKLYKVYVLGDTVHVYQRHSLPNLPPLSQRKSTKTGKQTADMNSNSNDDWCVKFDSQRPYPKLQDFGFDVQESSGSSTPAFNEHISITKTEVRPIVETLKRAFGLELFGFDILETSTSDLLVVDVNYFPSYKEVPNFPSLLAQYLTHRVLESRQQQQQQHCGQNDCDATKDEESHPSCTDSTIRNS